MVKVCDNCGRENEDEFKFCLGCGSSLGSAKPKPAQSQPDTIDCPNCGAQVPAAFKFCGACGTPMEDRAAESTAEVPRAKEASPAPAKSPQASASPTRLGELTVIRPDGTEGARIPVTEDGARLGRDSDFEVLANDPFLAPRHAEIEVQAGALQLRPIDEINGVFWRLRDDVELGDGDLLRVGQELLRFRLFEAIDPVPGKAANGDARPQGSPDPGIWGRLSLVAGPGVETRAFSIAADEVTIGRELGTILFRDDGFVSGKHARIYRDNGRVFLRDLGSSNGTYIQIRNRHLLTDGDLVLMGQQLLRVSLD